jgi:tRNA(Ile)-lysidine synthase
VKAKHKLEHVVFNSWKKCQHVKNDQKIVVAVSGGSDSMVLLNTLMACFPKNKLIVVHCHHGAQGNTQFRNDAQKLVESFCKKQNLVYEVKIAESPLSSEAEFREFRLNCFRDVAKKYDADIICLAHHRDDWLENQLIKLIRGSSFSSLRKSFQWSRLKDRELFMWRPFFNCGRLELVEYRNKCGVGFVEDPSNLDTRYFRNWLRNHWLPQLEAIRPGSMRRLGLSLINSIAEIKSVDQSFPWDMEKGSINLIYFLSLSESEKLRCLAFYAYSRGLKGIKSSQLKEIVRQLDKNSDRYHIHFKTFDCSVNAGQLFIHIL